MPMHCCSLKAPSPLVHQHVEFDTRAKTSSRNVNGGKLSCRVRLLHAAVIGSAPSSPRAPAAPPFIRSIIIMSVVISSCPNFGCSKTYHFWLQFGIPRNLFVVTVKYCANNQEGVGKKMLQPPSQLRSSVPASSFD